MSLINIIIDTAKRIFKRLQEEDKATTKNFDFRESQLIILVLQKKISINNRHIVHH